MDLVSRGVGSLLKANERLIDRSHPKPDGPLDTADFAWAQPIADAWPDVRAEVDALIAQGVRLPRIEDVTGFDQGNVGPWTTYMLCSYGEWIDFNCARCPRTTALVRQVPGLQIAGFSVLEPGTHIPPHRGPNRGALRYQLGVRVPGDEGDCGIRVGGTTHVWRDRASMIFDHSVEHEAWNRSEDDRYLLFLEVLWPLEQPLDTVNRATQRVFSLAARGLGDRVAELEAALNR